MTTLLTTLYIISGLYSILLLVEFVSHILKNKSIIGISKADMVGKYSAILLTVCLVVTPVRLYYSVTTRIPETTYMINGILEIDGDANDYSVPIKVDYFIDIEYEEDESHDYLFDGGISTSASVDETFLLLDITPPSRINIPDFEFEQLESLPETVRSNKTYNICLYGLWIEGDDRTDGYIGAQLSIPPLTKENLGITLEDQLQSVSTVGYAEHLVAFLAAGCCLFLLKKEQQFETEE